jgi:hypothetical protein
MITNIHHSFRFQTLWESCQVKEQDLALFLKLFNGRKGVFKQRSTKINVFEDLTEQHLVNQLKLQDSKPAFGFHIGLEQVRPS